MAKHAVRHTKTHRHPRRWKVNQAFVLQAFDRRLVRTLLFVVNAILIGYTVLLPPSPAPLAAAAAHGVQEPIRISFTKPVLRDAVQPVLTPAAEGTWEYVDPVLGGTLYRGLVFTPATTLLPEQHYALTLNNVSSVASVYATSDTITFETGSYPAVTQSSVGDQSADVAPCDPITLTLDRPVTTAGAFTISTEPVRDLDVSLADDGTSYRVLGKDCLQAGQSYVLTAEPSLPDSADSSSFRIAFSTKPDPAPEPAAAPAQARKPAAQPAAKRPPEPRTVLAIANDRQDKPLSCEVAALKMALNYKGAGVSEDELLAALGVADPTARDGNLWGDPNAAFVGDVLGHQNSTGYGVHWGPIARIARQYASAEAFSGWSPSDLARELAAGNPVELWGTIGRARRDSWQTPSGATVNAWVGEHTRLAVGFTGTVDKPTSFIINDPAAGQLTWTANQLRTNWGAFGNSGVVIR